MEDSVATEQSEMILPAMIALGEIINLLASAPNILGFTLPKEAKAHI